MVPAKATHIVGGEFNLAYSSPGRYQLTLTVYFDDILGNRGAIDDIIQANIFENRPGGQLMQSVLMNRSLNDRLVAYSNPACEFVVNSVRTRILTYTEPIELDNNLYTFPGGYIVTWERCCRNGAIINIDDPGGTGQAFALTFPPLVDRNGRNLINSSPSLFRPLSDFACLDQNFRFDFSGTDPDGDSLAYFMAAPFAGFTTRGAPGQYPTPAIPTPPPYQQVSWAQGFSNSNQINGPTPLTINARTGQLQMRPDRVGLHVFAIECREYRRGVLLGTVRREFQVLVRDCEPNSPTQIVVEREPGRPLATGDTLIVYYSPKPGQRCFPVQVTDNLPDDQVITLVADPVLVNSDLRISINQGRTGAGRPFITQFCINTCTDSDTVEGMLKLRVRDAACPIPNQDSTSIFLRFFPLPIRPVVLFSTQFQSDLSRPFPDSGNSIAISSQRGVQFNITALDSARPTQVSYLVEPALPAGSAISVTESILGPAKTYTFNLRLACPSPINQYRVRIVVEANACRQVSYDTAYVFINLVERRDFINLTLLDSTGVEIPPGSTLTYTPGQRVNLLTRATGSDSTDATLSYFIVGNSQPVQGVQSVEGIVPLDLPIVFPITCNDAPAAGQRERLLRLNYEVNTLSCQAPDTSSGVVTIRILEEPGGEALVPNIITSGGDAINPCFRFAQPGPIRNCRTEFEKVRIYNRWGRKVYESGDINFCWIPDRSSNSGGTNTYFYRITLSRLPNGNVSDTPFAQQVLRGWLEVAE
jgi:hypothetical protein